MKWWNVYYDSIDQSDCGDLLIIQVQGDTEEEALEAGEARFKAIVLIHSNWSFNEIREAN